MYTLVLIIAIWGSDGSVTSTKVENLSYQECSTQATQFEARKEIYPLNMAIDATCILQADK